MANAVRWNAVRLAHQTLSKLPLPKERLLRLVEQQVESDKGTIHFDRGQRICVCLADYLERTVYQTGIYEPEITTAFCQIVQPGSIVFDVGAHVGYYTLLAAVRVGALGAVHSFEPVPEKFDGLRVNVALNGYENAHINRLALWSEERPLQIYPASNGYTGTSSVLNLPENAPLPIEATATTIDAYVRRECVPRVDVIKLDVEAAELFVLRGARETLATHHPDAIIEMGNYRFQLLGYSESDLVDFMESFGYHAFRLEDSEHTPADSPAHNFSYAYFSCDPKLRLPPWK